MSLLTRSADIRVAAGAGRTIHCVESVGRIAAGDGSHASRAQPPSDRHAAAGHRIGRCSQASASTAAANRSTSLSSL